MTTFTIYNPEAPVGDDDLFTHAAVIDAWNDGYCKASEKLRREQELRQAWETSAFALCAEIRRLEALNVELLTKVDLLERFKGEIPAVRPGDV